MAGSADVIKEFLVSLGFKVDEAGLRNFNASILRATQPVINLGTALVSTTIAIEAMVTRVSSNLDRLYFASERTGSTVSNLQGIEYAAARVGLTAGQATGAVEAFARTLRTSPGFAGVLQGFGVDVGKKPQEQLLDYIEKLSKLPYYLGVQYAQLGGIDEATYRQLSLHYRELKEAQAEYETRQKAAGVSDEAQIKAFHDFSLALGHLTSNFEILGQHVASVFLPWATAAVQLVDKLVEEFNNLSSATKSWAEALTVVAGTAVGGLLLKGLGARLLGFGAGAAGAAATTATTGAGLGFGAGAAGAAATTATTGAGLGFGAGAAGAAATTATTGAGLGFGAGAAITAGAAVGAVGLLNYLNTGNVWGERGEPLGAQQHNPGNLRRWAKGQRTENGFAVFDDDFSGLSAMAGQLQKYGREGTDTLYSIINRYAPSKDGNNTEAYLSRVAKSTGFDKFQKLNLNDPDTLLALQHAMIMVEQGKDVYGEDLERRAINSRLGISNTPVAGSKPKGGGQISQTNNMTFNVTGKDANAIAGQVKSKVEDSIHSATRYFSPVTQ